MTGHCDSIGYWREALFIASTTHRETPCAAIRLTPLRVPRIHQPYGGVKLQER
jgi:hypothetical protein